MRYAKAWFMVLVAPAVAAQVVELGPVDDWEAGAAEIIVFDSDAPTVIGQINAEGRVEVELPEEIEPGRSFADSFSCAYEGEITISAPDAMFSMGPALLIARVAEEEMLGELRAFSSSTYATEWRAALSAGDNAPEGGSSFAWIHVSEPVRVEGICEHDMQIDGSGTAPVKIRNEYAMDFDAGWQYLETEIRATVESSTGVTWATDSLMHTAARDSDRIDWVVFLER